MRISIMVNVLYILYPLLLTNIMAVTSFGKNLDEITAFDDPVQIFVSENPDTPLPPWQTSAMPVLQQTVENLQADLRQVNNDLSSRIAELKEDGHKLKTSIEEATDATLGQINMLKTQVFLKIHQMQQQVSRLSQTVQAGDCQDLYELGYNATGVYYLQKFGRQVHCDMETDNGGWLIIQRRLRVNPQINFDQSWHIYKKGFGDLESEFWIGNEFLHVLTSQKDYRLVVDMYDYEKGAFTAAYSNFRVGNEDSRYALFLGEFSGNTSDSFSYHHGRPFTANDRDNDLYKLGNCATYFSGGWWYESCYDAHLNGVFPEPPDRHNATFITWWALENNVRTPLVLTSVAVKVKPAD